MYINPKWRCLHDRRNEAETFSVSVDLYKTHSAYESVSLLTITIAQVLTTVGIELRALVIIPGLAKYDGH